MARSSGEGSWRTINRNGKTIYEYRIVIDGKQKSFYGKSKADALAKYSSFKKTPDVGGSKKQTLFYDYAHDWLFNVKKKKVKIRTFDYYDFIIEHFIKDTDLGNISIKKLNSLSNREAENLFKCLINKHLDKSKSTLDGIHTVLTQICKHGVAYEDFRSNFMGRVDKISEKEVGTKKKEISALEYDDVMKLWDEMLRKNEPGNIVNNKAGTYVYSVGAYALLFVCFTGLRWGELSRLQWKDIQEYNGQYYFKIDKQYVTVINRNKSIDRKQTTITDSPKSEKSERYIPLSDQAKELLDLVKERFPECYEPEHLIFSTTNRPYGESMANRLLKAMCTRAGVPLATPHSLRHSFASILLNEDEKSLYAVSEMMGHSSPDVTYKKYIDIFEKKKIETMDMFNNLKKKKG